jgi:microcystin-dependent protein
VAQPYVGEIRMFGGNFAPAGWMFCEGQLVPINQNDVLFQLIGTIYGGDGENTFGLPDLRGRLPLHMTNGFPLGGTGGVETVTLNTQQIPQHSHPLLGVSDSANSLEPTSAMLATTQAQLYYNLADNSVAMSANAIGPTGGSQPHDNRQPFLCVSFIISLYGLFPSQT